MSLAALWTLIGHPRSTASGAASKAGTLVGKVHEIHYVHGHLRRRRADLATSPDALAFREKSIVGQMTAVLLVYGYYGFQLWGKPLTPIAATAALIGITTLMILILIAAHIAIRLYSRYELPDERDRVIELRGSRIGYAALAVGVWVILFLAIGHIPYDLLFYAIIGVFALAELVRLAAQLFYYRCVG